jgi:hypothetical protein
MHMSDDPIAPITGIMAGDWVRPYRQRRKGRR